MSDYISREADGDDFVRRADIVEKFMDRLPSISVGYLCKIADEIPAANVRPVRGGEWWPAKDGYYGHVMCSACHKIESHKTDFCPNCGADMMGGADG